MTVKTLKRSFWQRLFGVPATGRPSNPECWSYCDGVIVIDPALAPELAGPGGALRLEGGDLPQRILVVHSEDGKFRAYHNRCTHLGHRRLDPVPGTATVQCCSVNKSTYNHDGHKIHGPAPAPVAVFPVTAEDGKLRVHLS
jgi:nitrite reductase/ring-hydroxylating ferredoxin subunit